MTDYKKLYESTLALLDEREAELERFRDVIESQKKEIARLKGDLIDIEAKLKRQSEPEIRDDSERKELLGRIRNLEAEIRTTAERTKLDHDAFVSENNSLLREAQILHKQINKLQGDLAQAASVRKVEDVAIDRSTEIADLQKEISRLRSEIDGHRKRHDEHERQVATLNAVIDRLKKDNALLKDRLRKIDEIDYPQIIKGLENRAHDLKDELALTIVELKKKELEVGKLEVKTQAVAGPEGKSDSDS